MLCGAGGLALATPAAAQAADGYILTIPPWYRGLVGSDGTVKPASGSAEDISKFVWTIGLNIADAALQVVAYVAVGFVIYGGFIFMTSGGSPERAAGGRKTIINALVALLIASFAVVIINVVTRMALGL